MYKLVETSGSSKTKGLTSIWSTRETCADTCPLGGVGGCYAEGFPSQLHWNQLDASGGIPLSDLIAGLASPVLSTVIRYGSAGDLPGIGDKINRREFLRLCRAFVKHLKRPIFYTHKPIKGVHTRGDGRTRTANRRTIDAARNLLPTAVNVSCDSYAEARRAMAEGLDCVVVSPSETKNQDYVDIGDGKRARVCHAARTGGTCANCGAGGDGPWCLIPNRGEPIAFPSHGSRFKKINRRLRIINNPKKG